MRGWRPSAGFELDASSHARYLYAALRFQAWLDALQKPAAIDRHVTDRQWCAYTEDLWLNGEGKLFVGDTMSAM